jgi:hypothetical protein
VLRKANKATSNSPNLMEQLKLQRHAASAIVDQSGGDHVDACYIAAWKDQGQSGSYLTVELAPRFDARASTDKE